MARQPLKIGTHGEIRTYYRHDGRWHSAKDGAPEGIKPDRWKAVTQFRDEDGATRQVERASTTEPKAKRALRDYVAERSGEGSTFHLTAASRVKHAAEIYLAETRRDRKGTTYDRYRGRVANYILPRMGDLLIREASAGRINAVLQGIRHDDPDIAPETLRGIRACISGIMQVAIDRDVIAFNPVRSVRKIEGGTKRAAEALEADELADFLTKLDADRRALRADLPDFIRFLFGTGARFGEALALRWGDCNLTDQPIIIRTPEGAREKVPPRSVWFNGNLVHITGQGVVRHEGKTAASAGIVGLPDFLHALLLIRAPAMAAAGAGAMEPVFPSEVLGWRRPANMQRSVRRLRERIGHPNFTTHVGRKTVARVLKDAGQNTRQIADQLRHSSVRVTEKHYLTRGIANLAAAAAINAAHQPAAITDVVDAKIADE